jgi:hypothetical protein
MTVVDGMCVWCGVPRGFKAYKLTALYETKSSVEKPMAVPLVKKFHFF